MSDKHKNESGTYISSHTDKRGRTHIDIYDRDPRDPEHKSIHLNWDHDGHASITRTTEGEKKHTDTTCYITTACMRHFKGNFDDNCYELSLLRWFRDNYVSEEDIALYYELAPTIVETINEDENANSIYENIYNNVISYCVTKIEQGDYVLAYEMYKNSVIKLEELYARPKIQNKLVKSLKKRLL